VYAWTANTRNFFVKQKKKKAGNCTLEGHVSIPGYIRHLQIILAGINSVEKVLYAMTNMLEKLFFRLNEVLKKKEI